MYSAYVNSLRRYSEQRNAEQAAGRATEVAEARTRLAPLRERLARALQQIPEQVLADGITWEMMRPRLAGRKRGSRSCHCGEWGEAMRALGYAPRRVYSGVSQPVKMRWFKG